MGVLLVLASMVAGAEILSSSNDTVAVWAATRTLSAGSALDADSLVVRQVRLSAGEDRYLPAADVPAAGSVLLRTIGEGELIPRSAVGSARALKVRPVTVALTGAAPDGLVAGAQVEIWVGTREPGQDRKYATPELLVSGAEVSGVREDKSAFSSGGMSAEVLVPLDNIAALLAALANEDSVTLTPVPGTAAQGDKP